MFEKIIIQFGSPSLEMVILMVTLIAEVLLSYVVYKSNPKSATHRIFGLLSFVTICWLATNYLLEQPSLLPYSLWLHRLSIFFATPMSVLFFLLAYTMPSEKVPLSRPWFSALIAGTIAVMGLTLSPYAFTRIIVSSGGNTPFTGIGLLPFSLLLTLSSSFAVFFLLRKYLQAEGIIKRQIQLVLTGIFIMLSLIILTVLFPILLADFLPFQSSLQFLPLTPLYTLIFLALTGYAIARYQLFDVKVLASQAITMVIWLLLFAKIFGEADFAMQLVDTIIFLLTLIFGLMLLRSVQQEVTQRELIETQAKALTEGNRQQEETIHFITHQVKGFFTKSRGIFSMILEGDYGPLPEAMRPAIEEGFRSDTRGVSVAQEILSAANIKRGELIINKEKFDFKDLVEKIVSEHRGTAESKKVRFSLQCKEGPFTIFADRTELEQVVANIIENAIIYTPAGNIDVVLSCTENLVRLSVSDTGIGISEEDKAKLFMEGGRGTNSQKINVNSTGYGLFIAKRVIEAHDGKIWVESPGIGKGATFVIELPLA